MMSPLQRQEGFMKTSLTAIALASLLVVLGNAQAASTDASGPGTGSKPGVVAKVEKAVARGAHAAASGIQHGVKAATGGVERGAKAAGGGIKRGADATARGVDHGAKATAGAAHRAAQKVGGVADSSPGK